MNLKQKTNVLRYWVIINPKNNKHRSLSHFGNRRLFSLFSETIQPTNETYPNPEK